MTIPPKTSNEPSRIDLQIDDLEKLLQKYHDIETNYSRLSTALESGKIGVWEWDLKKSKINIDMRTKELFGHGARDINSQISMWSELSETTDLIKWDQEVKSRVAKKEQGIARSVIIVKTAGKDNVKTVLITTHIDPAENHVHGTFIDVSDVIPKSTADADATLDYLPVGVVMLDADGAIRYVNPATIKIFGIDGPDVLLGKMITEIVPLVEAGIEYHFTNLYEKNVEFDFESPPLFNFRGDQIYLHCRGSRIQAKQNNENNFLVLFSDITRRKQLENQITQSQRLESIGKLAGGVAHDFNNILTVIKGASALVMRELADSDPKYQSINQIHRAAERAESLTRQLLAFSRRQLLQPKVISLHELIDNMKAEIQKTCHEKIKIKYFFASDSGKIKADPHQIEQIIKNLVLNANDAMPDGGTLTIETKNENIDEEYLQRRPLVKPGRYTLLAISDSGVGMDKDIQDNIFEPFFTTKEKGQGTGMGLSTVYGIVKQSNGIIWTYSEPGKGTTFKIYLPSVRKESEKENELLASQPVLQGTETVLIVEDETFVRDVASSVLKSYGYRVLTTRSGEEAL